MIRLTNLADYAVVLMCYLAQGSGEIQSAVALSRHSSLPVPTVSKILGALSRAGLLKSQRGLGGGFSLARPAEEISVAAIVEALDGPIALTHCVDSGAKDCDMETLCMMKGHWNKINNAVRGALSEISLSEISEPSVPVGALGGQVMGEAASGEAKRDRA